MRLKSKIMKKRIVSMPVLNFLSRGSDEIYKHYPFNSDKKTYWYSARVAIWHALKKHNIDKIAVPAFSCGSELDPFIKAKTKLVIYSVKKDTSVDLESLTRLLKAEKPDAVFITHYFGFPQDMKKLIKLCEEHGAIIFEDAAHALFSEHDGKALGSFGDVAFFSLAKTLPVPDGGVLIDNLAKDYQKPKNPCRLKTIGRLKYIIEQSISVNNSVLSAMLKKALKPISTLIKSRVIENKTDKNTAKISDEMTLIELNMTRKDWGMSNISKYILRRQNPKNIKEKRIENYKKLDELIKHNKALKPLFKLLPDGTCPLFFPVIVKNPKSLQEYLFDNNIYSKRFWTFFHKDINISKFEWETYLKQHLIALPIHQNLDINDIEQIGKKVNEWCYKTV